MNVLTNSTNLAPSRSSKMILSPPPKASGSGPTLPEPLLFNLSISVPLPPSDPHYSPMGRQTRYVETSLQRYARSEFLRKPSTDSDTDATSSSSSYSKRAVEHSRVNEWVRNQVASWRLPVSPLSPTSPLPLPLPISLATSTSAAPRSSAPSSKSHDRHHRLSLKPLPPSPSREVLYAIPEDSEEPEGYREPYIFYCTSHSCDLDSVVAHAWSVPSPVSCEGSSSPSSPSSSSHSSTSLSPPQSPPCSSLETYPPQIISIPPADAASHSGASPRNTRRRSLPSSELEVILELEGDD